MFLCHERLICTEKSTEGNLLIKSDETTLEEEGLQVPDRFMSFTKGIKENPGETKKIVTTREEGISGERGVERL